MRWFVLLFAVAAIGGVNGSTSDLQKIDELNKCLQIRFETPAPAAPSVFVAGLNHTLLRSPAPALGMTRMTPSNPSFGQHYLPQFTVTRDFEPENDAEKYALDALEAAPVHVGLYLFGRAILDSRIETPNYRALKGPAAVTQGAPRPKWYPTGVNPAAPPDALPDWKEMYPLAQRAMKSFVDGGTGFETSIGMWSVAVRPVVVTQERCLTCHNSVAYGTGGAVVLHQALGGVIYAFRRPPA
jgi:hypothetical protein